MSPGRDTSPPPSEDGPKGRGHDEQAPIDVEFTPVSMKGLRAWVRAWLAGPMTRTLAVGLGLGLSGASAGLGGLIGMIGGGLIGGHLVTTRMDEDQRAWRAAVNTLTARADATDTAITDLSDTMAAKPVGDTDQTRWDAVLSDMENRLSALESRSGTVSTPDPNAAHAMAQATAALDAVSQLVAANQATRDDMAALESQLAPRLEALGQRLGALEAMADDGRPSATWYDGPNGAQHLTRETAPAQVWQAAPNAHAGATGTLPQPGLAPHRSAGQVANEQGANAPMEGDQWAVLTEQLDTTIAKVLAADVRAQMQPADRLDNRFDRRFLRVLFGHGRHTPPAPSQRTQGLTNTARLVLVNDRDVARAVWFMEQLDPALRPHSQAWVRSARAYLTDRAQPGTSQPGTSQRGTSQRGTSLPGTPGAPPDRLTDEETL